MKILVINAGSSSLKYQLIDTTDNSVLAKGLCERIGIEGSKLTHKPAGKDEAVFESPMKDHSDAINLVLSALTDANCGVIADMNEIDAVGHRVVHGGEAFTESAIITEETKKAIDNCSELAPLHNPANLIGIEACEKAMPGKPMVAVFDTAFHQTMPEEAYLYAIPYKYYEEYKVRKYGFHGTSHKYVANRCAQLMGKPIEDLKIITCHLGNGSSITAVDGGKSVDTSMGFTPLAGVPMGTRAGVLDPAVVQYMMNKENISIDKELDILNKESGVLGISGISSDFRDVMAQRDTNHRAKIALDMFSYSVKKYIGFYAAAMGGVDAIVFTAGVGENDAFMREQITSGLDFMGVSIDSEKNKTRGKEADISAEGARVHTFVIPTNEELAIAIDTEKLCK